VYTSVIHKNAGGSVCDRGGQVDRVGYKMLLHKAKLLESIAKL
jgi:hypothetical protein